MGTGQSQHASEPHHEEPQINDTIAKPNLPTVQASLPYNCEEILKHADLPVDRTSASKLYEQLYKGVFLNQNKKKYWVDDAKRNCFILFAQDLSITWAEDDRFWHWPILKELSDDGIVGAELVNVCWLEVHGRFAMANLTPETTYEVVFVVKLKDPAYGWEISVNLRVTLPDGSKHEQKETLVHKPREQWVEIKAGEFRTLAQMVGDMEFSLYEYEGGKWKKGLVIKGVNIRPKAS